MADAPSLRYGVEYAVRYTAHDGRTCEVNHLSGWGDPTATDLAYREQLERVERYRGCWPDAHLVERTVEYGLWVATWVGDDRG